MGKTADLSTSLRFGRDDKGEGRYGPWLRSGDGKPQISPLRCASVEMTKGRVVMVRGGGLVMGKTADLSTRCASVEMTKGRVVMVRGGGLVMGKTADLSTRCASVDWI